MDDLKVLEKILIDNGRLVDHVTISSHYSHLSNVNNKINSLVHKGLLVNVKKGLYYISKIGSLGYTSTSTYIIANAIGENSFVSFEGALKYHGLFDQGLKKYRSIGKKQYLSKNLEGIKYVYVTVKNENYYGYKTEKVDDGNALIATKERALLDMIEYQRTIHSVSLVTEKICGYLDGLDMDLLVDYLKGYSQLTIKTIGLIFDLLNLDTKTIEIMLSSSTSTHKLLESSDKFNSKWRIYYDSILEELG